MITVDASLSRYGLRRESPPLRRAIGTARKECTKSPVPPCLGISNESAAPRMPRVRNITASTPTRSRLSIISSVSGVADSHRHKGQFGSHRPGQWASRAPVNDPSVGAVPAAAPRPPGSGPAPGVILHPRPGRRQAPKRPVAERDDPTLARRGHQLRRRLAGRLTRAREQRASEIPHRDAEAEIGAELGDPSRQGLGPRERVRDRSGHVVGREPSPVPLYRPERARGHAGDDERGEDVQLGGRRRPVRGPRSCRRRRHARSTW